MRTPTSTMTHKLGGLCLAAALWHTGCGAASDGLPQPTPTPSVSLADLVLLMHFDEATWNGAAGQVADSSGWGHHGTAVGGAATVPGGRFGRAGSFGVADGVRIEDNVSLHPTTQLTVSAWVSPNSAGAGTYRGVVAKRIDYGYKAAYTLHLDPESRPTVDVDTEDDRFPGATGLANGVWHHVAFVYDGRLEQSARVSVYVSGVRTSTGNERAASIQPFDSPLWIGCLPLTQPAQGFQGLIDEVAVWHRALTPDEVLLLAGASAPLPR
jgi:MSHA biogenesis protein MshQ